MLFGTLILYYFLARSRLKTREEKKDLFNLVAYLILFSTFLVFVSVSAAVLGTFAFDPDLLTDEAGHPFRFTRPRTPSPHSLHLYLISPSLYPSFAPPAFSQGVCYLSFDYTTNCHGNFYRKVMRPCEYP